MRKRAKDDLYRWKLNMLQPGLVMLGVAGGLLLAGLVLRLLGWWLAAALAGFLAAMSFGALLLLTGLEACQDAAINAHVRRQDELKSGRRDHGI